MLHLKLQKPNWKVHMVYEQSLTGPCPSGGYLATAVSVPISSSAPIMDLAELVHGARCRVQLTFAHHCDTTVGNLRIIQDCKDHTDPCLATHNIASGHV